MLPFEGGIQGTANGTLVFAVLLAVSYLFYGKRRSTPLKIAAKTLSVGFLAFLSFLEGGPALLTLALLLCAAGDFFLAMEDRDERFFAAGLGTFLAGHLAYVALFAALHGAGGFASPISAVIGFGMFAAGMFMAFQLWRVTGPLRVPVMVYIGAIVSMGVAAVTTGMGWIIAGAASFMASDTVLAADRFLMTAETPLRQMAAPFVWITYFGAQVAILLGIVAY